MSLQIRTFVLLVLTLADPIQIFALDGCKTPLGSIGYKMRLRDCVPIVEMIRHHKSQRTAISPTARLFIKNSFIQRERKENNPTFCCDLNMNVTRVFESVGAEILRILAPDCGDNVFKRISFGVESTFMTHPWSVLLVYNTPQRFHCGGSLITNRYVLTAAHCVNNSYLPLVGVRLREHNTSSEQDCEFDAGGFPHCYAEVIELKIEKKVIHENYSHLTLANDIALLRMEKFVDFERSIRPICIPEFQNQLFNTDTGVRITGWGSTEKSQYSAVLLQAEIALHPLEYCQKKFSQSIIDDTQICGAAQNATHTCKGDSGGPVIIRFQDRRTHKTRYMQIGIISAMIMSCGDPRNFPMVFVKTSAYVNWIAEHIEI